MVKKVLLVLALASLGAMTTVAYGVDYSDFKQRNPQNDPDVEKVYQQHQKEYKEKKEAEDRYKKLEIKKPYEVDRGGIDDANVPYTPPSKK
jgi:hypothetical protein